jgi:hypothetical protein
LEDLNEVPVVSWLPVALTPGRLILVEPLKDTPPIVRAVVKVDAVSALPVTSPVTSPVTLPVRSPVTSPVTAPVTSPEMLAVTVLKVFI